MKLRKIHIDGYKNLATDFSFEDADKYIALIGLNGSGKSNLLEVISLLFGHVMGIDVNFPFSQYSLMYDIRGHSVDITEDKLKDASITSNDLPSSVIACYSGEDSRLWNSGFKEYYVHFFNAAIGGGDYKPRILYVNKYCWKIAFISLLFSENNDIKKFILEKLHIDADTITIQVKTKDGVKLQKNDASNWYQRIVTKFGNTEMSINDLKDDEDVQLLCEKYPSFTDDQIIFYYLYFLHIPDKRVTIGLQADKIIESIDISLNGFSFDDLSEGEKKLILVECITKVLGDENSLILLDEPDAYTHIAMKKELLKLISGFEGQTIMTTHSPMFLNKRWDGFNENNIFYMHDGEVENTELLKHLGDITDNEIDYFEGSFILSSKKILVTEGSYDIAYIGHAINELSTDNPNYLKLTEQVAFLHAGGASNAVELYNQTLFPARGHYDNLVFIFDYDKSGFEGAEELKASITQKGDTKPIVLFYQDDYSVVKSRKPNDKDAESYMVEDLFDSDSYHAVTDKIHVRSHKDLRNITWNGVITSNKRPKGTPDAIKYYIQDNYTTFKKEWLQNFKPVLDKLLEVFSL